MASKPTKAAQSTQDGPQETVNADATTVVAEVMRDTFDDQALRAIKSFDEAAALAAEMHGPVAVASEELGDGFTLLKDEDKRRLVGVPCLFMEWDFYAGDYGADFVAVRVVARNPDGSVSKYIINDGSTGINEMLRKYTENTGRRGGLAARNGLRASEYVYCELCQRVVTARDADDEHKSAGKHKKAATYYIDTSA